MLPIKLNLFEFDTGGLENNELIGYLNNKHVALDYGVNKSNYIYYLYDDIIYQLLISIDKDSVLSNVYELKKEAKDFSIVTLKELYSDKYNLGPNIVVSNEGKYRLKNNRRKTCNYKIPSFENKNFYLFCSLYKTMIDYNTNNIILDQDSFEYLYFSIKDDENIYNKFLDSLNIKVVGKVNYNELEESLNSINNAVANISIQLYDLNKLKYILKKATTNKKIFKNFNLKINNKKKIKHI